MEWVESMTTCYLNKLIHSLNPQANFIPETKMDGRKSEEFFFKETYKIST